MIRNARRTGRDDRGVSPVIGAILVVAIVILLAVVVSTFVLGVDTGATTPNVKIDAETLYADDPTFSNDQRVNISHGGGESVDVSELEIIVEFSSSSKRGRLVNLPPGSGGIDPVNVEGDDVFDGSPYTFFSGRSVFETSTDSIWTAGETIKFRISSGEVSLSPGDEVYVTIVHKPSNTVLKELTITARSRS